MRFLYHLSQLKTIIVYHLSTKMPPSKANENFVKKVLSVIWTWILSFVDIPVVLAEYFFGKRMSVDVQSCNNNEQKNGNSELTESDLEALRSSWDELWASQNKATKIDRGVHFFYVFFRKHYKEAKKFFPQFVDVKDVDTLKTIPRMKAHAMNVMNGINTYIDNLDDEEMLVSFISNMLRTHRMRGVGPNEIELLVDVMHDVLDLVLGDKSTESLKKSWTKFFGVILQIANK